ncbi:MAG: hypothetical protein SP4CHLAM5_11390 [Chlamydiia bacterium]|nr:hypothetical protein [Chlamydiia bacterium]
MTNIRQRWLYTFIAVNLSGFLYLLFGYVVLGKATGFDIIFNVIGMILGVSITMHCSYINRGTKWLFFQVIAQPLGVLTSLCFLLYWKITGTFPVLYAHYATLVFSPLYIYFAWQCYLLRNQYLQEVQVAEIAAI